MQDVPSVSIVVPVRDEVSTIAATLDACLAQEYDGDLEVIVALADSSDGTDTVLAAYADRSDIRIVPNPGATAPSGLNAAIAASTADVVVRCDGHAVLPQGYVSRAVDTLMRTGAGNVGGIQRAVGSTAVQYGIARAMGNPIGVGDARFHTGGPEGAVDTVYLGVFLRRALDEVGGFDESLDRNQDYELNIRLREAGWTVWFDPSLEVAYAPRDTFGGLWRQYHAYGAWKRHVVFLHPQSTRPRQLAAPLLVAGLAAAGVSLATPARKAGMGFIAAYAGALMAAGGYEVVRTRDVRSLLAAPAIGVMHIAWGTGFIAGRR